MIEVATAVAFGGDPLLGSESAPDDLVAHRRKLDADALPMEIKTLKRFVVWKLHRTDSGPFTKMPYQCDGRPARVNDHSTWCTFDQALEAYQSGSTFSGIGIVLGQGLCGVDLDHCVDSDGELKPWAEEIVRSANTYTEYSPSGQGVHILFFGALSDPANRRKRVAGREFYADNRYFTLTGDVLPARSEIRASDADALYSVVFNGVEPLPRASSNGESPDGWKALSDDEIVEAGRRWPGEAGKRFRALFDHRNITSFAGDESRADLALANYLVRLAHGDIDTADRLFRRSKLMRPKWDEMHFAGGRTYGEATLELARKDLDYGVGATQSSTEVSALETYTLLDVWNMPEAKLVSFPVLGQDRVIIENCSHILAASPKFGKTTLLVDSAVDWARSGRRVLYITEESKFQWRLRVRDHMSEAGHEQLTNITVVSGRCADPNALLDFAKRDAADIVVVDSITGLLRIPDHNSAPDVDKALSQWVASLTVDRAKTLIMTTHSRKTGGDYGHAVAGSFAMTASVDVVIELGRRSKRQRILTVVGRNFTRDDFVYEMTDEGSLRVVGDVEFASLEGVKSRVAGVLRKADDEMVTAAIRDELDPKPSPNQVSAALKALAEEGTISRTPPISVGKISGITATWRYRDTEVVTDVA